MCVIENIAHRTRRLMPRDNRLRGPLIVNTKQIDSHLELYYVRCVQFALMSKI